MKISHANLYPEGFTIVKNGRSPGSPIARPSPRPMTRVAGVVHFSLKAKGIQLREQRRFYEV